jgi:hypothetical protein
MTREIKAIWESMTPNVRAAWISIVTSSLTGFVAYATTIIKRTKPVLVFVRRKDKIWQIRNIGSAPAFDVKLEAYNVKGECQKIVIYPIGDKGDPVFLPNLTHGDKLMVYYRSWNKFRHYVTTCEKWENNISFRPSTKPIWKDGEYLDETRLQVKATLDSSVDFLKKP